MKRTLLLLFTVLLATLHCTSLRANDTDEWGRLQLVGNQLSDQNGNPIQLKGWDAYCYRKGKSTYDLNYTAFMAMKACGANAVHLTIFPKKQFSGAICVNDATEKVKAYIDMLAAQKMYVVVSWDEYPENIKTAEGVAAGRQFFDVISNYVRGRGYNHVIYKITPQSEWPNIKSYIEMILPTIEDNDPGAIVIIGHDYDLGSDYYLKNPLDKGQFPLLGIMHSFCISEPSNFIIEQSSQIPLINIFDSSKWADNIKSLVNSYLAKGGKQNNQLISWFAADWNKPDKILPYATSEALSYDCDGKSYLATDLSTTGRLVQQLLGKELTDVKYPQTGAYEGYAQPIGGNSTIPTVLDISRYDHGGEGVAYHDLNSTYFEKEEGIKNTGAYWYEYEASLGYQNPNPPARMDEAVDLFCWTDYADKGDFDGFPVPALSDIEPSEWIAYTIDVKAPGYYRLEVMTNSTPGEGTIGLSIDGEGNILRNYSKRTQNSGHPTSFHLMPSAPYAGDEYNLAWVPAGNEAEKDDLCVYFSKAGVQRLVITMSPDCKEPLNSFGNLRFTSTEAKDEPKPIEISGFCGAEGDNLKWVLSGEGQLTISGTGAMAEYEDQNVGGEWVTTAPWRKYLSKVNSVTVDKGVTTIGSEAFYGMTALQSATLPNTLQSIGMMAFSSSSLQDIDLGKSVKSIGEGAFQECSQLQKVTVPESVTEMEPYVFNSCYHLSSINLKAHLTTIPRSTFTNAAFTHISLPEGVEEIGKAAFSNCEYMQSIKLPSTLKYIRSSAFSNCSALKSVEIPEGVTAIEESVFSYCNSMTSITLPSTLQTIGACAFDGCNSLSNIILPASLKSIDVYAFDGCPAQQNMTCLAVTPPNINADTFTASEISKGTLYVPAEAVQAYKEHIYWKKWGYILPIGGDVVDGIRNIQQTSAPAVIYNLQGQRLDKQHQGINIVNGKKVRK